MQTINDFLYSLSAANIADIGIMASLIYFVLAWLQGSRAFQILATLLGIGLFYQAASVAGLILTSVLFQYLWAAIIVVLVIVFQPEVREMLDRVSPIRYLRGRQAVDVKPDVVEEIVRAIADLARQRIGALVVFPRLDRIDGIVLQGKQLDCEISAEALIMIFQKTSPLHDGAVTIFRDRIQSAGCILPVSKNEDLASHYGTRHRAAVGLTERSDAVCIVVSEERAEVSLVEGKEIIVYKKKGEFREALERELTPGYTKPGVGSNVWEFLKANWGLKILSLITAVFLWVIVVGPQRSELGISIPIQYTNLPQSMEITGKWMEKIDVRLRGSEAGLGALKPGDVRAIVDLSSVASGLNFFRITQKNVQVPPGINISEIRPSDLTLTVETSSFKKVNVVPTMVGPIPENTKVSVIPAEVKVKGLQGDLRKLSTATTDPLNVTDLVVRGKAVTPVVIKPDNLRIESVEPMQVTVGLETEKQ